MSIVSQTDKIKENISSFFEKHFSYESIENTNNLIINTSVERVCDGIKNVLVEKYDIDPSELVVEAHINKENLQAIEIEEIEVYLTGKASWSDTYKIEEYLESLIGCQVSVKRR